MRDAAAIEHALARAVLARALRLAFQRPSRENLELLFGETGMASLARAAELVDSAGAADLPAAAADLGNRPAPVFEEFAQASQALFGHTTRGKVCPYETEYGGDAPFLQSQNLADITGFFAAFGLRPRAAAHERPDHIAVQLEFLEFLGQKEAIAREQEDVETLETTRRAYRVFLLNHLARFGPAFARSVLKADPGGPFGAFGRLCLAFLRSECSRLNIRAGPDYLPLRRDLRDDAPMACGNPEEELTPFRC